MLAQEYRGTISGTVSDPSGTSGRSAYNSLQVSVEKRLSAGAEGRGQLHVEQDPAADRLLERSGRLDSTRARARRRTEHGADHQHELLHPTLYGQQQSGPQGARWMGVTRYYALPQRNANRRGRRRVFNQRQSQAEQPDRPAVVQHLLAQHFGRRAELRRRQPAGGLHSDPSIHTPHDGSWVWPMPIVHMAVPPDEVFGPPNIGVFAKLCVGAKLQPGSLVDDELSEERIIELAPN